MHHAESAIRVLTEVNSFSSLSQALPTHIHILFLIIDHVVSFLNLVRQLFQKGSSELTNFYTIWIISNLTFHLEIILQIILSFYSPLWMLQLHGLQDYYDSQLVKKFSTKGKISN